MIEARVNPKESTDAALARFNASGYARFRRKPFANSAKRLVHNLSKNCLKSP